MPAFTRKWPQAARSNLRGCMTFRRSKPRKSPRNIASLFLRLSMRRLRKRTRSALLRRLIRILNWPGKVLAAGKHALVEKPMTDNAAQAAELVQLAGEKRVVLASGPC